MTPDRHRIFLLSPAHCGGLRAAMVMREGARFGLACRLREASGAPLGELFTFMSGLYFRGKLAYARAFARPPVGIAGVHVITPTSGLLPVDTPVTLAGLRRFARIDIDEADQRYRRPLLRSVKALVASLPSDCDVVILGSIATGKYVEVLGKILGRRLLYPPDFVGRGDMSRGGLLLRCARASRELLYAPVTGVTLHGKRPPRLPRGKRDMSHPLRILLALTWAALSGVHAAAQEPAEPYRLTKLGSVPRQPYERYLTNDRFAREITFYVSEAREAQQALPLVAYVHGSGCASHFNREGDRIVPANGHITLEELAAGKARVLIVEKPGVKFLDKPATPDAMSGSADFRREHTLERWAEAVEAAIRAALTIQGIQPGRLLVIGHSEGGLVACRVARDLSKVVTHVASMAGGGPSQLFDLVTLARAGSFFRDVSDEPEERVRYVYEQWRSILADPLSTEKLFFGFAYRRWSSFLASSPIEELSHVEARIYVAQGAEDAAVDPASSDALDAQLRARGRAVVYDRIQGADHSFNIAGRPDVNGWREQLTRIVTWYLASEPVTTRDRGGR